MAPIKWLEAGLGVKASGAGGEASESCTEFETAGETSLLIEDKVLGAELVLRFALRRSASVGRGA